MDIEPSDCFATLRHYEYAGDDAIIRRYFSSTKFLDFAKTWELYFAPASAFTDEEEGFYTVTDQVTREGQLRALRFSDRAMNIARHAWDTVAQNNKKAVMISCWTLGNTEDPRMWQVYGKDDEAVALETTVGALRRLLGHEFLFVPVQYIDRNRDSLPQTHSLEPFFFKGLDFQWEHELRIVAQMEVGWKLGTPRRIATPPGQLPFRLLLPQGARAERRFEVEEILLSRGKEVEIVPAALTTMQRCFSWLFNGV